MGKRQKHYLIPEELFKSDFEPLTGFFSYHVQGKNISVRLSDIQAYGVSLEKKKEKDVKALNIENIPINTIVFSSSKKNRSVHNLMWYIRCLPCHVENIKEVSVGNIKCYQLQNLKTGRLKGLIACDVWPQFIKEITNKIRENENN